MQPAKSQPGKTLLAPTDHTLVLIDFRLQMVFATKSIDPVALRIRAGGERGAYNVPTIPTTVGKKTFSGPMLDEIKAAFPKAKLFDRTNMNTWEDKAVIDEVNRIGNRRIVLAGLWTSVCIVGPTLPAIDQGFAVYVIADACGDVSVEARERAMERMVQARARPMTSLRYLLQLQRDWARAVTYEAARTFGGAYGLGLICAKTKLSSHASEAGRAVQSLGKGLTSALLTHRSEGDPVMRMYVVAFAAGALVGVIYGLIDVRSPAPPVVALVGLLGILAGEQVVPFAKRIIAREPIDISWVKAECAPHIFGELPTKVAAGAAAHKKFEHEC